MGLVNLRLQSWVGDLDSQNLSLFVNISTDFIILFGY